MGRSPHRELKFLDVRYRAEGEMSEHDAKKRFDEATTVYAQSVGAMVRDGLIK